MTTTDEAGSAAVGLGLRLAVLVYLAVWAFAGYALWDPLYTAYLDPGTVPADAGAAVQVSSGFLDVMLLVGPTVGVLFGVASIALANRRWGGEPADE